MLTEIGQRRNQEPALLECENHPSCGRWIPHVFVAQEQISRDGSTEELYACSTCGHTRRWGLIMVMTPEVRLWQKQEKARERAEQEKTKKRIKPPDTATAE